MKRNIEILWEQSVSGFIKHFKSNSGNKYLSLEGSPRELTPLWNSSKHDGTNCAEVRAMVQSVDFDVLEICFLVPNQT